MSAKQSVFSQNWFSMALLSFIHARLFSVSLSVFTLKPFSALLQTFTLTARALLTG